MTTAQHDKMELTVLSQLLFLGIIFYSNSVLSSVDGLEDGSRCRTGYRLMNGECWKLFREPKTWRKARVVCHKDDAQLASPKYSTEDALVTEWLHSLLSDGPDSADCRALDTDQGEVWLGIRRTNNGWQTALGLDMTDFDWSPPESPPGGAAGHRRTAGGLHTSVCVKRTFPRGDPRRQSAISTDTCRQSKCFLCQGWPSRWPSRWPSHTPPDTDLSADTSQQCPGECRCTEHAFHCDGRYLREWRGLLHPPSTHIVGLALGENNLTSLPPAAFTHLSHLIWIYLDNNDIQDLPAGLFDTVPQLKVLILTNNKLRTLPDGIFDKLPKLEELVLTNNDLRHIPEAAFLPLTSLVLLDLSSNPHLDCSHLYIPPSVRDDIVPPHCGGALEPHQGVSPHPTYKTVLVVLGVVALLSVAVFSVCQMHHTVCRWYTPPLTSGNLATNLVVAAHPPHIDTEHDHLKTYGGLYERVVDSDLDVNN